MVIHCGTRSERTGERCVKEAQHSELGDPVHRDQFGNEWGFGVSEDEAPVQPVKLADLPAAVLPLPCNIHGVLAEICGGPHRVVYTDLGPEVLAPGEEPQGTPRQE